MITRALVADGTIGENDAAGRNGTIEHAAGAEYDDALRAHCEQLFVFRDGDRRADIGHCEREIAIVEAQAVNRGCAVAGGVVADDFGGIAAGGIFD